MDDAAFLSTTKTGTERATEEYTIVANDFGLTLTIPKTKSTPVGKELTPEDKTPLSENGEEIEYVCKFPYIGSVIASNGQMDLDVSRRIAQASWSKAFGALRKSVFMDKGLQAQSVSSLFCCMDLSVGHR